MLGLGLGLMLGIVSGDIFRQKIGRTTVIEIVHILFTMNTNSKKTSTKVISDKYKQRVTT